MKKKRFIGLLLVVAVLALFIVPHFVTADEPFCTQRHTWKAKQWFRKAVEFFDNIDFTGADIDIDSSSDLDIACQTDFTDGVYFDDELVNGIYWHATASGNLTWLASYGNVLIFSGSTTTVVALPTITAALSGYILTVKNVSGGTPVLTPTVTVDAIEATPGTMTGTTDATCTSAGSASIFVAVHSSHTSGASSVWMCISEDV